MGITACPGEASSPAALPALGWATDVVTDPASFQALMSESPRDGWTALHAYELRDAGTAFSGDGMGLEEPTGASLAGWTRAWLAEAALNDDLQRLTGLASDQLFSTWAERGELPQGAALVATLAARCSGTDADRWTASLPEDVRFLGTDDEPWARFTPTSALPEAEGLPRTVAARMAAHWAAHDGPLAQVMLQASQTPLLEVESDGITRSWYDPCVHRTVADEAKARLGDPQARLAALTEPKLANALFSPWLDGRDLDAQLQAGVAVDEIGASSTAIQAALGLPAPAPDTDDPQAAREEIRALDARLDAVRTALDARADADGAALLNQIGVVDRLRQEILVARARRDLRAGHHQRALATLQLARDVTDRTIGPRNSPALMALLAEANLRAGRSREALDALQLLAGRRPEVLGLRELVGDLSVLQGLDRRGDSKEH